MSPTNADIVTPTPLADSAISFFLMINSLESGGSERQFTVFAQNISQSTFQIHLGCLSRSGPLADQVGDVPEFPLGGSLYGWQSLQARFELSRHLRTVMFKSPTLSISMPT